MPHKRLWLWPIVGLFALIGSLSPASASCGGGGGGLSAEEAGLLADFLILAVKPEGDDRDYKLVEIGDTKINAGLLGVVINTLPLDFLGLGPEERTYDEAAETAQCRAACRANAQCRDFSYVRPNASEPIGVCHLKRFAANASFGVMTPVAGPGEGTIIERPIREPAPTASTRATADKIVFDDTEKSGRVRYAAEDARATPLTLKFLAPVSNLKVFVRAADLNGQKIWASVEAFGTKGKLVERSGTWISVGGELNFGHAIAIATEGDRIAVVKITASDGGSLLVDGIEFARALLTPPPLVAEAPPATSPAPPREAIPPPPPLPPLVAEYFPLPPRSEPTAPPTPILEPVAATPEPIPEPAPAATPAQPIVVPAPVRAKKPLPIWLALGAVAFVFGGAGVYWHSHRKRMLTRISTRLVSSGLDRQTVSVESAERPDVSLRFVVRAAATIGAPNTRIDLIPAGAMS